LDIAHVDLKARFARVKTDFAGHGYRVAGLVDGLKFQRGGEGLVFTEQFVHGAAQLRPAWRTGLGIGDEVQAQSAKQKAVQVIFHGVMIVFGQNECVCNIEKAISTKAFP
jgi:hypothetical protein